MTGVIVKSASNVFPSMRDCMVDPIVSDLEFRESFCLAMKEAVPGTGESNLLVLTRVMFRVLSIYPLTRFRPVLSLDRHRPSLWQAAVLLSDHEEVAAFTDTDDEMALTAANLARWVLELPQQTSVFPIVFVSASDVYAEENDDGT